jgi:hypothetical protein
MAAGCALSSWDGYARGEADTGVMTSNGRDAGVDARAPVDAPGATDAEGGVSAPIAFVQVNAATTSSQRTTLSVPFTKPQQSGNLIVVAVGWYDDNVALLGVKDSRGNTYKRAVGPTVFAGASPVAHSIYYAAGIAAAEANANVVTVDWATAADAPDVRVLEYSGLDPVSPLDVVAEGMGASTSAMTQTVTTSSPRSLLFGAGTTQGDYGAAGGGYTVRIITSETSLAEDRIVDTIGTYAASAPVTNTDPEPPQWVLQLAVFH